MERADEMAEFLRRCWAVINLDNVAHNLREIRSKLRPGCMIMGVVKADAYGHGDKYIVDELVKLGVNWFAVSNINEAVSLRTQGIYHPILILGTTPAAMAGQLCQYNITQTVFSPEYACQLQEQAARQGVTVQCHIKVDTGMCRLGFNGTSPKALDEIEAACRCPNLNIDGIFTHFSSSDEYNEESIAFTKEQFSVFQQVCQNLEQRGITFSLRHCSNSGGIVNYPEMNLDMVRAGILMYGLLPDKACQGKIDLKPVMELRAVVSMVKQVEAGVKVSYGRTFTVERDMTLATIPLGYADGYHRLLSNQGKMLVNGQFAPIVGRVCMDQLVLDVTGIPHVAEGCEITVVGESQGRTITMDEVAQLCGTVNYEIMCILGRRVPRVYYRGGENIGVVDYIRHNVE